MKSAPTPRPAPPASPAAPQTPEGRPPGRTALNSAQQPYRLYINREWYIEVTGTGHVHGACFEGAFGCVIPLHEEPSPGRPSDRLALKIPRLIADTLRENEFIRHIVETEASFVREANRDRTYYTGLVPIERLQFGLLRGVRELRGNPDDPRTKQDGNIVLISFPKDRPPRIVSCRVDAVTGELHVFPPRAHSDLAWLHREIWERMKDPNPTTGHGQNGFATEFEEPYFVEIRGKKHATEQPKQGPLRGALAEETETVVWYTGLPSIIYHWACTTLQSVVCDGERQREWRLNQHYELHIQIARGIDTLHERGLLHGDIRPANIMAMGDPSDPSRFAVGDYGSFSVDPSRSGDAPVISGNTMAGASVSRQRTSLFYAPERRHGIERELADVAVVLSDPVESAKPYLICLGWREKLMRSPGGPGLRDGLREELHAAWDELIERARPAQDHPFDALDLPRPKDRLRLRDFVFEVIRCEARPGMLLFLCHPRFARVLHERIAAYAAPDDQIPTETIISLPCYSEIHQWSAATDLYGMGALAVYTLFMRAAQADYRKRSGSQVLDDSQNSKFETNLSELIRRLESISLLSELWGDIDLFWTMAAKWNEATENPQREKMQGSDITVLEFATKTANNLLRTPHMRYILQCFAEHMVAPQDGTVRRAITDTVIADLNTITTRYNIAHFLFFVHYVLSCIHRRSHLREKRSGINPDSIICADRCEPTVRANGERASKAALERLVLLQKRLNNPVFRGFLVDQRNLDFDHSPESEFQLRRKLTAHRDSIAKAREVVQRFKRGNVWERVLGIGKVMAEIEETLARAEREVPSFMSTSPAGALPPRRSAAT